jgi:hypothetical protein
MRSKCPSGEDRRLAASAVKGAVYAFTGAERKPLTEETGGSSA